MDKLKLHNKKASIASGLVMIPAMILILFMLIIYFVFIGIMFPDRQTNEIENSEPSNLLATHKLISFLEQPVENYGNMYGLLLVAGDNSDGKESEREEIFYRMAGDFLNKEYPLTSYSRYLSLEDTNKIGLIYRISEGYGGNDAEVTSPFKAHYNVNLYLPSNKELYLLINELS